MPKRIEIAEHLSVSELQARYREAKNPVTRSQYQIIWLLASGKKTEEVAVQPHSPRARPPQDIQCTG